MARSSERYNCTLVGPVLQIYQLQDTANDLILRSGSMCIDLTHKIIIILLPQGIIRDEKGTAKMEPPHRFIIPAMMDIMANERQFEH